MQKVAILQGTLFFVTLELKRPGWDHGAVYPNFEFPVLRCKISLKEQLKLANSSVNEIAPG